MAKRRWSNTDLAYLAGFIDGEGSISVFDYHNRRHSAFRLNAYNANRDVLDWIAVTFGGRVYQVKRRRPKWRPQFVWQVSAKPAVEILYFCRPFLKVKALQATIFIEAAATLNKMPWNHQITADVVEFRREAGRRISALNRGEANAG